MQILTLRHETSWRRVGACSAEPPSFGLDPLRLRRPAEGGRRTLRRAVNV